MREAVQHQLVLALEHHYADTWQNEQNKSKEAEGYKTRYMLRVTVTGVAEAASGMRYMLEKTGTDDVYRCKEGDAGLLRRWLDFHKERGASKEYEGFLRECLVDTAERYSDFRNTVLIEEK